MTRKHLWLNPIVSAVAVALLVWPTALFAESIAIPAGSLVSPAFIEGSNGADKEISATANGKKCKINSLSATAFFINVTLNKQTPTPVLITVDGVQSSGNVDWLPIDIDGKTGGANVYDIRQGDSLLLESSHGTQMSIGVSSGISSTEQVKPGQPRPQKFPIAGIYRVSAEGASHLGDITVRVFALPVDPALKGYHIASEVGFARTFEVPVTPVEFADALSFTTASEASLTVTKGSVAGAGINISLQPLKNTPSVAAARVGGVHGPVLATVAVDAFILNRTGMIHAGVVDWDAATGDTISKADIIISPMVKGLTFHFSMFAHSSTFLGGVQTFDVDSGGGATTAGEDGFKVFVDPATGIRSGRLTYSIISPRGEKNYCHTVILEQK